MSKLKDKLRSIWKNPNEKTLTADEFYAVYRDTVKLNWPDATDEEIKELYRVSVRMPFGQRGYSWSVGAAKDLAYEMMDVVGEL